MIQRILSKIANLVGRGIIKLVNDAGGIQKVQITGLESELLDNLDRLQEYGLTSNPPVDSECIFIALNGQRNRSVIIGTEDKRYRLKGLENGEVALYDDLGTKIHLKRDNQIQIKATTKVQIDSPAVQITHTDGQGSDCLLQVDGNIVATGNISANGDITDKDETNNTTMSNMRTIFNAHTHGETGGTTNAPNSQM